MSTYSENDVLDLAANLKSYREDACNALEEKLIVQDASNLKLEDIPGVLNNTQLSTYAYFGSIYYERTGNGTVDIVIKSNTSWTLGAGGQSASVTSGTGDTTVTITLNQTGSAYSSLSMFFRITLINNVTGEQVITWIQRKAG